MLNRLNGFFAKFQKSKKQSVDVRGEKKRIIINYCDHVEYDEYGLCGMSYYPDGTLLDIRNYPEWVKKSIFAERKKISEMLGCKPPDYHG
ncbi:MAG: hypothetical protein JST58_07225 [Bacteroidetes bacterium]|nr:hypothetical protein [Bacteroidota bacterium]